MKSIAFPDGGATHFSWLHDASGETGILIVPGGGQTRIGPARLFVRLAVDIAGSGRPVLRFDRQGIGDSGGVDNGFLDARDSLEAAISAFRENAPQVRRIFALGHCDGATAAALNGDLFDGLMLLNPWVVEDEEALPPAAAKAHYRRRLLQAETWKRLATGRINPFPAIGNLFRRPVPQSDDGLAGKVFAKLEETGLEPTIILSDRDRTAQIFAAKAPQGLPATTLSADHSFSGEGEYDAVERTILKALNT